MTVTAERKAPAKPKASAPTETKEYGIVIGTLAGLTDSGMPLVTYDGKHAIAAQTLAYVREQDIGKRVALQFERGDVNRPIVTGVLKDPADMETATAELPNVAATPMQAILDGKVIALTALEQLTLQCGKASITLDSNGHVEIRGIQILSRATGQNRIKGSSVSLN
jgi:hypothetical protein